MDNNTGIAFEGATLEEAYAKASAAFECSLTDLKSEILQAPSNGFLGLFKKNAIIKVYDCSKTQNIHNHNKKTKEIRIEDMSSEIESVHHNTEDQEVVEKIELSVQKSSEIFDDFYQTSKEEQPANMVLDEIKNEIDRLFPVFSNVSVTQW